MEITYKRIDTDLALEFADYILPVVAEDTEFERYLCYAVLDEGHLVGLLVADPRRIGPEILSIGLSPVYQKKGLARELLSFALEDMVTMYDGSEDVDMNYFGATILADPELAYRLSCIFEQCGFKPESEGIFYETSVGSISDSPALQNPAVIDYLSGEKGRKKFCCFKDLSGKQIRAFGNKLAEENISDGIVPEELEEDISYFGLQEEMVSSGILFFKENKGTLQNALLYRVKEDTLPNDLIRLLTASAVAACKKYPKETRLSFWAGDEVTRKLILKIFPDAVPAQRMITYMLPFDAKAYQEYFKSLSEEGTDE